ncbi:unnamed protein product [Owenia fusiformis]|uniref:Sushi domain-containing protein n=1 Tax=Owenia fusiformis TaxID=6347 RepID=A0A8S4MZT5_OWEFU|nr:unnamed protein product [Owenia fusiformis]
MKAIIFWYVIGVGIISCKCPPRQIATCSQPTGIEYGSAFYRTLEVGSVVRFRCDPLYELIGQDKQICGKDCTWVGPQPECKGECMDDAACSSFGNYSKCINNLCHNGIVQIQQQVFGLDSNEYFCYDLIGHSGSIYQLINQKGIVVKVTLLNLSRTQTVNLIENIEILVRTTKIVVTNDDIQVKGVILERSKWGDNFETTLPNYVHVKLEPDRLLLNIWNKLHIDVIKYQRHIGFNLRDDELRTGHGLIGTISRRSRFQHTVSTTDMKGVVQFDELYGDAVRMDWQSRCYKLVKNKLSVLIKIMMLNRFQ